MEIERASAFPTQVLVKTEELFNMPAIGKGRGQSGYFSALGSANEQQLRRSRGNGLSAAGMSQTKRLAGFGVQQEKALSLFARWLVGSGASLHRIAFGIADWTI